MKYETATIASLMLDPANVRTHDSKNLEAIKASLARFGQQKPIVVDGKGIIVAGNGTMMAAKMLNWSSVEIVRTNLEGAEAIAYAIADNRTAELAGWDEAALAQQLAALQINDEELANIAGFTDAEIEAMILDGKEIEEDVVPEPPVDPITKAGDLWLLGDHRVLCGDSTKAEDVARLMNGAKADMVFTDPPYGMHLDTDYSEIKGSKNAKIQGKGGRKYEPVIGDNDDFSPELIEAIFSNFRYCAEIFIWGADYFAELIQNRNDGSWLAWDKRGSEDADKIIGNCFELCWSKAKHKKEIARIKWMGAFGSADARERVHPTQKPLKLCAWFFNKYGRDGEVVADLFLGSGSTLIAAEQLNRKCYGMEISPAYCDVIVKRWETLTGKTATLST